jgi:thymidine kinase
MHSGKTSAMITDYKKIWNKEHVRVFKPSCDVRDLGEMKSKDFVEGIPAICIDTFEELLQHVDESVRTIFIDEANFLKGDVSELVSISVDMNIDIYICGLNMTSEQKPFGIMADILAVSDYIEIKKGYCTDCNREAGFTYFEGVKEKDIVVGDTGYITLCEACLRKRRKK